MKARDVMTKNVRTVNLMTPVREIAQLMISRRISAVPVVDKRRKILGIVSEGDLLRRTEAGTERRRGWWSGFFEEPGAQAREYAKSRGAYARDVMTRSVVAVNSTTDVAAIADLMEQLTIKRLPVVDGGKLVGIVSRRDLLRAVSRAKPAGRVKIGDADLHRRLKEKFDAQPWAASTFVNFVVNKGKVELFGVVQTGEQRDAALVLAETTPGVRSVTDKLMAGPLRYYGV
jgi:CBS domain-containing protein